MMLETILFVGLLCHLAEGFYICSVTCESGQYCSQEDCISCPEGSFQEEPVHQMTKCLPWTTKPSESNYVIAINGSATSDVVWKCQVGYYEHTADKCMKQISTVPYTSTTTSTTNTTLLSVVKSTMVASYNHTIDGSEVNILAIIVPILVVLSVTGGFLLYWRASHCARNQNNIDKTKHIAEELPAVKQDFDAEGDKEALLPNPSNMLPKDINFRFFFRIVEKLEADNAEKFLRVLDDPSGTFDADNTIGFERAKYHDREYYLTMTCLDWAHKNVKITCHKELVQKALSEIGRHNLLRQLEEAERLTQAKFADRNQTANNHSINNSSQMNIGEESSVDRITLFYYLVNKLGSQDALTLLYELPNNDQQFIVRNFFEHKRDFQHESFALAFVDTLEEWHLRNPDSVMIDCIVKILNCYQRRDVLEDEEFHNFLHPFAKTISIRA